MLLYNPNDALSARSLAMTPIIESTRSNILKIEAVATPHTQLDATLKTYGWQLKAGVQAIVNGVPQTLIDITARRGRLMGLLTPEYAPTTIDLDLRVTVDGVVYTAKTPPVAELGSGNYCFALRAFNGSGDWQNVNRADSRGLKSGIDFETSLKVEIVPKTTGNLATAGAPWLYAIQWRDTEITQA